MWATCSGQNTARFPIWSCSRWGLPCRWCCHPRGALLPHHFTLTGAACAALRRYLSVALSVGSRPPGVTWHRALWSPDFPPCALAHTATAWPTPVRTISRRVQHRVAPSITSRPVSRRVSRLGSGRFLLELKRAPVRFIVAHRGDLRGEACGLLERQ